jgi:hypothetical protein
MPRYPATPKPSELETVQKLAEDNPLPPKLRKQIANWIEPEAMNTYTDHADAMSCIEIAFPLIVAWLAEHPQEEK